VTPPLKATLLAATLRSLIRPAARLGFLGLCGIATASAQEAGDIDWVPVEQLSEAQRAMMQERCCGLYVEPPLPGNAVATGATLIEGDTIDAQETGLVIINGKLDIQQPDAHITADQGTFDSNADTITLQDNIRIRQSGMLLTGTQATVDQQSGSGEIRDASYVLHDIAARGTADMIVYTDANGIITINNGRYTRCEPGDNSWQVQGRSITLNQSTGRGKATQVKLRVADIPVLYLPWVSFPINDERSSGFLAPVIGSTRDGGLDFAAPYYLNLAPNYDLTITPRIQTKRGVMLGMEGRYLGQRSQQIVNMQYLPGDQLYDPATLTVPDTDSPPVPDRWWLDYDYRVALAKGWSASINYASVSDVDYFQDLGNTGLNSTTQSFLYRDARITYRGKHWDFLASTQGYQTLDLTVSRLYEPYRMLPRLNLDGEYYLDSGIELALDTEYVAFDRSLDAGNFTPAQLNAGTLVTGQRFSLTPSVSLPWSNAYAFATPALKYRYTSWNLSDQAAGTADSPKRGIATASVDSGLIFERDYAVFGEHFTQTLEPRAYYLYSEYEDQSDLPLFDSGELTFSFNQLFRDDRFSGNDRVGDANQLTLAVTSRFYDEKGQEKARASIGQIQYFEDRLVTLSRIPGTIDTLASSALVGEISYQLNQAWSARSYVEWNRHTSKLVVGNFLFQYQSDINHILNIGYRYRDLPNPITPTGFDRRIKQTDLSGVWPLTDNWGVIGRWNYDLGNNRNLEAIAGIEYSNCCWVTRFVAREWIDNNALFYGVEDNNTGIFLQFELKGLGSVLGGNVSGILNNRISGYQDRNYVEN